MILNKVKVIGLCLVAGCSLFVLSSVVKPFSTEVQNTPLENSDGRLVSSEGSNASEPSEGSNASEPSVRLEDIEPPVWDELFAIASVGDKYYEIRWGTSTNETGWFSERSSYPGFSYPMLVTMNAPLEDSLVINTNYGEYRYEKVSEANGKLNDAKTNLVYYQTGKEVIRFGLEGELLYVYNGDKSFGKYKLVSGTQIE